MPSTWPVTSSSSEETHDDDEKGQIASLAGHQQPATEKQEWTHSQESTGIGSKPSCGHQADGAAPKSRKRSLDELKATDPPEDEQHSSQSAFQQCCPHSQQNSTQQPQATPLPSHAQGLQLLLSAAQSCEGISQLSQPLEGVFMPADHHGSQHALKPVPDSIERPAFSVRSNNALVSRASPPRPAQPKSQQTPKQALGHVDILYAPIRSAPQISTQLIWDTQRLEHPALDADSVQAALEFADVVQIDPAQQPGTSLQHPSEPVSLLHTLEVGIGRLGVLRILAHRLRSSSLSNMNLSPGGVDQLLDVLQDLLKDMESSQLLLCHAEQTVLAYQQAALAPVDSLRLHTRAAQDHWLQTRRLQDVAAERRAVLQSMMMLPEDCPGRELLELYEKLREAVVHALEVSACRAKLSCDMQTAQARLLAQGVSGVTTTGMMNGAVELAVNRPVLRLQSLLRILHGIDRTKTALLGELASALAQGPWHLQRPQHMHDTSFKLAEAVTQVQARIHGLLHQGQGWRASCQGGQNPAALIPNPLAGMPVGSGTSTKAAQVEGEQGPNKRRRSLESVSGGQGSPDEASPRSALPLHVSTGNAGLLSNASKSGPSVGIARGGPASEAPLLLGPAQAPLQTEKQEHVLIRPRAQRPQSGVSHYESGRDPRAHHKAARQARLVMPQQEPQREQQALPALPRTSAVLPLGRVAPHVPSGPARANPEADLGTARSPEVFAAAQALLQSQLQQLAVRPELLNLFQALCADSKTSGKLLQASARASGPAHDFESPFQHGKSHCYRQTPVRPVLEGLDIGKLVSESHVPAGGTTKLGRTDSGRGVLESSIRREGGPAVELNSVTPMNTSADSEKLHSLPAWQQDSQAQAATYAQHLYGLLAQAQAPNGNIGVQL
ncbi:hypothetical protein ABBQ32_013370 [Trebouxia sp. C0010 RCD-2024]